MQALPIRILLANHLPIIRSGLRFLLDRDSELQVVAEAANGREALVLADYKHPDIVLLEIKLPLVSGMDVARQITSGSKNTGVLFVTDLTDESYMQEAFRSGASGYVAGDAASSDLPRAIRMVARQQYYLSPSICAQLLQPHVSKGNISEQDRDLWCLIAAGYGEPDICSMLQRSVDEIQKELSTLRSAFCRNSLPDALVEHVAMRGKQRIVSAPTGS